MTKITTNNIIIVVNIILHFLVQNKLEWALIPLKFWESKGEWIKLLSSAFMHADLNHLAYNMIALYTFGSVVNKYINNKMGTMGYLIFYIIAAVANSFIYTLLKSKSPIPTLGASGAIASVMAIYFLIFKDIESIKRIVSFEVFGMLFRNATGINYLAHVIGLILGFLSFKTF
jgi:membrane associated rhomboid family serine protease